MCVLFIHEAMSQANNQLVNNLMYTTRSDCQVYIVFIIHKYTNSPDLRST